jgi:hypothetical protein
MTLCEDLGTKVRKSPPHLQAVTTNGRLPASIEHCPHQISELLGREFVAFQVCNQFAVAPNHHSVQRMNEQAFIRHIVHPEQIANALDVR